jgi:peptidoglycan/xylan/chitin deacetylase (PgdA/CDA1 family)
MNRTVLLTVGLVLLAPLRASADDCVGNPNALGTERILAVDAAKTPRVGRKQFPATLPLAPKEVVLTFDDGPSPGTTERVLIALKRECVRATFFVVGRRAEAYPQLIRRIVGDGHTLGNHTHRHPLLSRMQIERAQSEIDRGSAAIAAALRDTTKEEPEKDPEIPFFRFPGFASNGALLERLEKRGVVVFGADLWASDWNRMSPQQELRLVLQRLTSTGGGIVLFHDTQPHTAAMIPEFLRELKRRGYRVVHVVPANETTALSRGAH